MRHLSAFAIGLAFAGPAFGASGAWQIGPMSDPVKIQAAQSVSVAALSGYLALPAPGRQETVDLLARLGSFPVSDRNVHLAPALDPVAMQYAGAANYAESEETRLRKLYALMALKKMEAVGTAADEEAWNRFKMSAPDIRRRIEEETRDWMRGTPQFARMPALETWDYAKAERERASQLERERNFVPWADRGSTQAQEALDSIKPEPGGSQRRKNVTRDLLHFLAIRNHSIQYVLGRSLAALDAGKIPYDAVEFVEGTFSFLVWIPPYVYVDFKDEATLRKWESKIPRSAAGIRLYGQVGRFYHWLR
jgi:hypothetical protein